MIQISGLARVRTPWVEAATAYVGGDFASAAEIYAQCGSFPDEALARLRLAEALVARGDRRGGEKELQRALVFYRSVDAKAHLREAESLLARTA